MRKRCLALFAALALLLSGCGGPPAEPVAPATILAETAPTTAPTVIPETTEMPTESATLGHSGLREDGSFDEGTWFIGDSLTYYFVGYLLENGLLGDMKFSAQCGSQVTAFFGGNILRNTGSVPCRFSPEFKGLEFQEAARVLGEDARAIYILWGTNFTYDGTAQDYIDIVDFLLENCPNATIHLQLIPYGTPSYVFHETVNGRIREAYDQYSQTGEERVILIDTYTAIGDNTIDGVHLNPAGNAAWYQAILDSAEAYDLIQ